RTTAGAGFVVAKSFFDNCAATVKLDNLGTGRPDPAVAQINPELGIPISGTGLIVRNATSTYSGDAYVSPSPGTRFCVQETPWLAIVKGNVSQQLPWDIQAAAIFQSQPGPRILATATYTTAQVATSLLRPLAGGARTVPVDLIAPDTEFGDRMYA